MAPGRHMPMIRRVSRPAAQLSPTRIAMLVAFRPGRRLADREHLDELAVVDPGSLDHRAALRR